MSGVCVMAKFASLDTRFKNWGKVVTGVDLAQQKGFALRGEWLKLTPTTKEQCMGFYDSGTWLVFAFTSGSRRFQDTEHVCLEVEEGARHDFPDGDYVTGAKGVDLPRSDLFCKEHADYQPMFPQMKESKLFKIAVVWHWANKDKPKPPPPQDDEMLRKIVL